MTMKIEEETRKFRGKDIIVFFSEYKDDCHFGFNVDVHLTVDDFIFVAASSFKPNKEAAYEQAIERLEKNLLLSAKGVRVEEAESDLCAAQDELTYRKQEQNTACWFLDFTKDKG